MASTSNSEASKLQRRLELQSALLSQLKADAMKAEADARAAEAKAAFAEGRYEVCAQTVRDFRQDNIELRQRIAEVEARNAVLAEQLRESEQQLHIVEAELMLVLDARDADRQALELLSQEQSSLKPQLLKVQKQLQAMQAAKLGRVHAYAQTENIGADASLQTEPSLTSPMHLCRQMEDLALFPLRSAAQKLREDLSRADQTFQSLVQGAASHSQRKWADMGD
jgi:DNA repair exonuclease SbcCD ATPase subunit